jgi:hypothetical protein
MPVQYSNFERYFFPLSKKHIDNIRTPRNPAKLELFKQQIRKTLVETIFNGFPQFQATWQKVGQLEMRGYAIEKWVIESQPGLFIPANIYRPDGVDGPMPAILHTPGHAPEGKGFGEYQRVVWNLMRLGYVVLNYDPLGQGERGKYGSVLSGNHHDLSSVQCIMAGSHAGMYFTWDAMKCLDLLLARDDVDPDRIGMTGCSGGGCHTFYVTGLDERITCAVSVVAGAGTDFTATRLPGCCHHMEDNYPGACSPEGVNWEKLCICIVPRPFLILTGKYDFTHPETEGERYQALLKPVYHACDAEDKFAYRSCAIDHGYGKAFQEEACKWFAQWFGENETCWETMSFKELSTRELECFGDAGLKHSPQFSITGLNYTYWKNTAQKVDLDISVPPKQLAGKLKNKLIPLLRMKEWAKLDYGYESLPFWPMTEGEWYAKRCSVFTRDNRHLVMDAMLLRKHPFIPVTDILLVMNPEGEAILPRIMSSVIEKSESHIAVLITNRPDDDHESSSFKFSYMAGKPILGGKLTLLNHLIQGVKEELQCDPGVLRGMTFGPDGLHLLMYSITHDSPFEEIQLQDYLESFELLLEKPYLFEDKLKYYAQYDGYIEYLPGIAVQTTPMELLAAQMDTKITIHNRDKRVIKESSKETWDEYVQKYGR